MPLRENPALRDENRLLAALPRKDYERLASKLEPVSLGFKDVLAEPDKPAPYVYFPRSGVISLVTYMADGAGTEVGIVGSEGMAGISVFPGSGQEVGRVFCQAAGEALRMKAKSLREETKGGSPLNELLLRYTQALLIQVSQSTACNRLHTAEERLCRWLLMTHDRVRADQFPITRDFMADMLGVRRPTVSLVAGTVQRAGLIRYSRGKMTVVDRPRPGGGLLRVLRQSQKGVRPSARLTAGRAPRHATGRLRPVRLSGLVRRERPGAARSSAEVGRERPEPVAGTDFRGGDPRE